jgi:hypothetical protein
MLGTGERVLPSLETNTRAEPKNDCNTIPLVDPRHNSTSLLPWKGVCSVKRTESASSTPPVVEPSPSPDVLLDLDDLRLPQNFEGLAGVKKAYLTIPVRRPRPQAFVRVREEDGPDLATQLLVLKEDRDEVFLVDRALWPELQEELVPHILAVAVDRQANVFVWPLRVPAQDGRSNAWHTSALQAASYAKRHWIRVKANMALGAYDVSEAAGDLPAPEWPPLTTQQILTTAFKDKHIRTLDHPALRRLRGEL